MIHSATASVCSGERGRLVSQSAKSITFLLLALCLASCNTDAEYDRLNLETDCFDVQVAPETAGDDDDDDSAADDDDSAGDDEDSTAEPESSGLEMPLTARPGLFGDDRLGTAWVTPASGPAGTHFLITVVLEDNGLETGNPTGAVDRIAVLVDNGSLTASEFDMDPSPADESRWTMTLGAGGDPETALREDSVCLAVYAEIE